MSFVESSFFPVPPDVMLAPMCLAQPHRAWRLALLTTLASVAGGLLGYSIGYFAIDILLPWLQESRYWPAYQKAVDWFGEWGFWVVPKPPLYLLRRLKNKLLVLFCLCHHFKPLPVFRSCC